MHTPASRDLSRTLLLSESTHTLQSATRAGKELADRASAELRHCGLRGPFKTELSMDVRYVGQSFELNVPLTRDWKQLFEAAHLREFHFVRPGSPAYRPTEESTAEQLQAAYKGQKSPAEAVKAAAEKATAIIQQNIKK